MSEKITILNQFTVLRSGHINVQLATFYTEAGTQTSEPSYHRGVLNPGDDPQALITAWNEHLPKLGRPVVSAAECDCLFAVCKLAHTPEKVAAWQSTLTAAAMTVKPEG